MTQTDAFKSPWLDMTPDRLKRLPAAAFREAELFIWEYWLDQHATMTRSAYALGGRRQRKIRQALKLYPVATILAAIRGVKKSAYHMGANPKRRRYNNLETILRDEETIERHAEAELTTSDDEKVAACPLEARPGESAEAFKVRQFQWWEENRNG